jgi:hypothetical protein
VQRLPGDDEWQPLSLDEIRKVHIQKILRMCNGNRVRAAQILGIGRTSLYRYLKRDGCDTPPHSHSSTAVALWLCPGNARAGTQSAPQSKPLLRLFVNWNCAYR